MNSGPSNQKSPKVHIYLLGESLADLALQYQLSLAELLEANQLTLQSILYPGQKLIIPETVQEQTSAPLPQEHIVALGESLISIATKYGLTVESLRAMNDLGENAMLYPGTYLSLQAKTNQPEFDSNQAPKHCLVHGYHRVWHLNSSTFDSKQFELEFSGSSWFKTGDTDFT
ncbi:MAG: LysM peptidoglycan-binding domain-containing protein [Actinobacteria bacterium]|nr:LysM peptidoglycan-binding domain-containing protein [Actinomycetota bacterium]